MTILTPEEERIRKVLIEFAKRKSLVYYSDLLSRAKVSLSAQANRTEFGHLLGHICEYEHEHGRPLLSCVTQAKDGSHGGFYDIAESLYNISLKNNSQREVFLYDQMNKVFDCAKDGGYDGNDKD